MRTSELEEELSSARLLERNLRAEYEQIAQQLEQTREGHGRQLEAAAKRIKKEEALRTKGEYQAVVEHRKQMENVLLGG